MILLLSLFYEDCDSITYAKCHVLLEKNAILLLNNGIACLQ